VPFTVRTQDDEDTFYNGVTGIQGEESVVFASRRMLQAIQPDDVVAGDDTYKLRPYVHCSAHVFIVSLYAYGEVCFRSTYRFSVSNQNILFRQFFLKLLNHFTGVSRRLRLHDL